MARLSKFSRRHRIKHSTPRMETAHTRKTFSARPIILIAGAVLVLVLFIMAISPSKQLQNSPEILAIQDRGMLRVGVLTTMPGFSNGEEGFEVALADQMAREVFQDEYNERSLELVPVTSHTADIRLTEGEIDMAMALLTDPQNEAFLVSSPYYEDRVRLYCAPENSTQPLVDQTVGVVQNTPEAALFEAFNEQNESSLLSMPFASYPDLIDGLKQGRIAYAAIPEAWSRRLNFHTHTHHEQTLGSLFYVAVCHNDTPALVDLADLTIDRLQRSGEILDLRVQYGV